MSALLASSCQGLKNLIIHLWPWGTRKFESDLYKRISIGRPCTKGLYMCSSALLLWRASIAIINMGLTQIALAYKAICPLQILPASLPTHAMVKIRYCQLLMWLDSSRSSQLQKPCHDIAVSTRMHIFTGDWWPGWCCCVHSAGKYICSVSFWVRCYHHAAVPSMTLQACHLGWCQLSWPSCIQQHSRPSIL